MSRSNETIHERRAHATAHNRGEFDKTVTPAGDHAIAVAGPCGDEFPRQGSMLSAARAVEALPTGTIILVDTDVGAP